MQKGQPVAYTSRALTETERNYAQIEKELLSIVSQEISLLNIWKDGEHGNRPQATGNNIPQASTVYTKKTTKMLLCLQKYDINIVYKQGKHMYLANTLSRAYMQGTQGSDTENSETVHLQTELERELEYIDMVQYIPATDQRLQEIKQATANDLTMQQLITTIVTGWPEARHEVTSYEIRQ